MAEEGRRVRAPVRGCSGVLAMQRLASVMTLRSLARGVSGWVASKRSIDWVSMSGWHIGNLRRFRDAHSPAKPRQHVRQRVLPGSLSSSRLCRDQRRLRALGDGGGDRIGQGRGAPQVPGSGGDGARNAGKSSFCFA